MPVHPLLLHGPSVVGLVTLAEEVPPSSSSSPFALPLTLHLLFHAWLHFFFLFFPFTINLHAQALLDFFFLY